MGDIQPGYAYAVLDSSRYVSRESVCGSAGFELRTVLGRVAQLVSGPVHTFRAFEQFSALD